MAITLSTLIDEVESTSGTEEPLRLLATASALAGAVPALADALLSHFVDRSRRAGHSWSEIGTALGVTKQAVQKRFTGERTDPIGWQRFTERARSVVGVHAQAVAAELGQNYVGTEHLLAGCWGEPDGIAAQVLGGLGVGREVIIAGIDARIPRGTQGGSGYTPRAWTAIENSPAIALELGHNYVGTEHLLLALMNGVGGVAEAILKERGVTQEAIRARVITTLAKSASKK